MKAIRAQAKANQWNSEKKEDVFCWFFFKGKSIATAAESLQFIDCAVRVHVTYGIFLWIGQHLIGARWNGHIWQGIFHIDSTIGNALFGIGASFEETKTGMQ